MGMFDDITLDAPLVVTDDIGKILNKYCKYDYQTKSLENCLFKYRVDSMRRLMCYETENDYEEIKTPVRWVFRNHTGIVTIYEYKQLKTYSNGDTKLTHIIELELKFLDGNLIGIKVLQDKKEKHKKKKPFTLTDHIKKIVSLDHVILEPEKSYHIYAFTISLHETESLWCITTHAADGVGNAFLDKQNILHGYPGKTPPLIAYSWNDPYAASRFLHTYFKNIKKNKWKVKVQ
jgi:hypothetical protein